MLVERGLRVMDFDVVNTAYGIASNYLTRRGAIPPSSVTNDRLLEIIVRLFERGETNHLRLGNKAITIFETTTIAA